MPDLWVIFLTGLTVGGFSCMAVQGGLLASAIATREKEDSSLQVSKKHSAWPTIAFLASKLVAYTILGFVLGAFGGVLTLSDSVRAYMQLAAGLYMIAVAGDLLQLHPIFRYAILQPPKFLTKLVRNQAKSKDFFAPALLGAMTIFIPCGTTLAMEALAISSGNAVNGALVMGAFILGTSPLFFGLGLITTALGDAFRRNFFKLAGVIVIYLGATSVSASLNVLGRPINLQTLADFSPIQLNFGDSSVSAVDESSLVKVVDGVQVADIQVLSGGYSPNYLKVRSGVPVKLNLVSIGGYSCAAAFTIPQYNIRKLVPRGGTATVEFTPDKKGKVLWTCSMGMYSGTLEVI